MRIKINFIPAKTLTVFYKQTKKGQELAQWYSARLGHIIGFYLSETIDSSIRHVCGGSTKQTFEFDSNSFGKFLLISTKSIRLEFSECIYYEGEVNALQIAFESNSIRTLHSS